MGGEEGRGGVAEFLQRGASLIIFLSFPLYKGAVTGSGVGVGHGGTDVGRCEMVRAGFRVYFVN